MIILQIIFLFQGMAFLHSLDRELPRFYLNSRHVLVDSISDNELCARLNMADAKFTFMDRAKNYHPQWMAPEVKNNTVRGHPFST